MAIIQKEVFNVEDIVERLRTKISSIGAGVTFTGYVRDFNSAKTDKKLTKLHIEHYPELTLKALIKIEKLAHEKWDILATEIIHRVGDLKPSEPIVGVVVLSEHRDEAFDACHFIIDYLKTEAPFWKKELTSKGNYWVEKKEEDERKTEEWRSKL